ncbi:MAG: hypothetical protein QOI74_3644 [Micromonosporaceae bacterium]|jgi:hypothetical protein|nr:hypothetical protein [Micromonosporaceae bacterium]MDT5038123.1 hypothetical protein [Micromonosporaceae bacterium]
MTNGLTALRWSIETGKPATVAAPQLADVAGACEWLATVRAGVIAGLEQHGAVYLRGLPIRSARDFAAARDVLIRRQAGYQEKATPRSTLGDGVFSSTDLPATQSIQPHNENSYTLTFPGLLLFGCLVAPGTGGATPVTDCRQVLRSLPPDLVERFRTRGWGLLRNYAEHLSINWSTALGLSSAAEVPDFCARNAIAYRWHDDGHLRTGQRRSAIIRHPRTGADVWFNHVAFWSEWSLDPEIREVLVDEFGHDNLPFNTTYGDGSAVSADEITSINRAYAEATVRADWEPGALLLVDNILAAHGREAFTGDRTVVVAMGDPTDLADCAPTVHAAPMAQIG